MNSQVITLLSPVVACDKSHFSLTVVGRLMDLSGECGGSFLILFGTDSLLLMIFCSLS